MKHEHHYALSLHWTGNRGTGTSTYQAYSRDHVIEIPGKPALQGSSDPAFRGDASRYNPEDLLVAALSACHMLWYLHLCASAGIVVTAYRDDASGVMVMDSDGGGHFSEVVLHPEVAIEDPSREQDALRLHEDAHRLCFIARSVNFPVHAIGRCVHPAQAADPQGAAKATEAERG
ncbi:MAG: OsmC family protein [Acidobacteria bacterium]|nr:OsmC family protein [Acidobacteriota bacterium]